MWVLEVDLVVWGGNSRIWYPEYSVEGSCRHVPRLHGFLALKEKEMSLRVGAPKGGTFYKEVERCLTWPRESVGLP